ncbi:hypothetical protein CQW23_08138 [Capsicum baccatum]|uniref:Uncharacterized protein n=1 Tax=Capsicum baccatum TaxID=33114 RepID=A0A2G2X846_CAPBA|nr:hypothetical protein CQW23_08138 [Capsicum baccatum]
MLQKMDITKAIYQIEISYFLVDIVLKNEIREEGSGFGPSILGSMSSGVRTSITDLTGFLSSVYIQPQAWQATEENINASRESSGQWQAAEDNINARGGSSEQWQAAKDNINASKRNRGH